MVLGSPTEPVAPENGVTNEETEPVDPDVPKKCDVIVLSGRKERCEAAVEALKVGMSNVPFVHLAAFLIVFIFLVEFILTVYILTTGLLLPSPPLPTF